MSILALTSDTLIGTPAAGNIEYNGQFFGTDSNASRAQLQRIVQGTVNAGGTNPFPASSGPTAVDYTNIPTWVKKITVMFSGVSTSGTIVPLIQIGSGSFTSSGYISTSMYMNTAGAVSNVQYTTGFGINQNVAAGAIYGSFTLSLVNSATNSWVLNGGAANSSTAAAINISSGGVSLGGTLDRVRITTLTGVDTFDAGSVNILYEG